MITTWKNTRSHEQMDLDKIAEPERITPMPDPAG